jgi:hypothetical protein
LYETCGTSDFASLSEEVVTDVGAIFGAWACHFSVPAAPAGGVWYSGGRRLMVEVDTAIVATETVYIIVNVSSGDPKKLLLKAAIISLSLASFRCTTLEFRGLSPRSRFNVGETPKSSHAAFDVSQAGSTFPTKTIQF